MSRHSLRPIPARSPTPEALLVAAEEGLEPPATTSPTSLAQDAARSGVADLFDLDELDGLDDDVLQAGDPDVSLLDAEYSGDQIPGGESTSPDQNNVDDVGRAYGLTDEDAGSITSTEALGTRRDLHRWELDPRSKDKEI